MNLFLDDYRNPNIFLKDIRTWVVVRNYKQFVDVITKEGLPSFLSMDHDLSIEHYTDITERIDYSIYREKTGYDCALWLVGYCYKNNLMIPEYQVHSMNPVGKENIIQLLESYKNRQRKIETDNK